MKNWDRLVDAYMEQYAARGLAQTTVQSVRRELDRLGCWLKNRRPRPKLEEVNADHITAYMRSRMACKAKATVASAMSTIRGFGEFLVQQGTWRSSPLRWMRGPKLDPRARIPRRINGSTLKQVLEAAASSRQAYHRHMWVAMITLMYGTGLRRGELNRLNVEHWSAADHTLRVDGRKTGQERQVVVPELAVRCVEHYLPQRHNHLEAVGVTGESALFVNKDGGRLSGIAMANAVKRLAKRCGVDNVTPHQFRHTCASDLLEGGVHLPEVQRLLGHQSIATTVRYLHIADPQRHAAVAKHPINEILGGPTQPVPQSGGEA